MRGILSSVASLAGIAAILPIIILMTGCGSTLNVLPTLSNKTKLAPEEGVVVARVINASSYPLPFNHITLDPENLNESKKIKSSELSALAPYHKGTTVFASPIKSGTYALSNINAYHYRGEYRYYKYVFSDAKFGTFEVRPGQVTDLGTLIFYPKPQTDKYIETLLRLPEPEIGEVMDNYFPFYQYNKQQVLSWNDDDRDEERESLFVSVAQNPVVYTSKHKAPDGSIYFLGKLGIILKRLVSGEWETDGVDTNLHLNSIAQNEQGDLIVGGEEGRLFWKPAGGEWQDKSLEKDFRIHKLFFSNDNTIDMVASQKTNLFVFRSLVSPSSLSWEALNQYDSLKGWKSFREAESNIKNQKRSKKSNQSKSSAKRISQVVVDEDEKLIRLSQNSVNSSEAFPNTDFKIFAYQPDTWQTFKPSEAPEMDLNFNAGQARLGLKKPGFWSWSGRNSYYRYDEPKKEWVEINTHVKMCNDVITQEKTCLKDKKAVKSKTEDFSFSTFPVFKSKLEAITIASFSSHDFWSGKWERKVKILRTQDGGISWADTGFSMPNEYCSSLVPEVTDRLLLSCNGATGEFYESFDDGASWQQVRDQENF